MSRIGKKNISIPVDVSLKIEGSNLSIMGKFGKLEKKINENITLELLDNQLRVVKKNDEKSSRSAQGLFCVLINNMILGVTKKFSKILVAEGVGYKFQLDQIDKKKLILSMGYSHPVIINLPEDITVTIESPTRISISGIDKERVGLFAAKIRDVRPPEPYKGKGILYEGEKILRKVGKTGKK